jgi:hypothetical protein
MAQEAIKRDQHGGPLYVSRGKSGKATPKYLTSALKAKGLVRQQKDAL